MPLPTSHLVVDLDEFIDEEMDDEKLDKTYDIPGTPARWRLGVQVNVNPANKILANIGRPKTFDKRTGKPKSGLFKKSCPTVAQVIIVVGAMPEPNVVREALKASVVDGKGLLHNVQIGLDGQYTFTENSIAKTVRENEEAQASKDAEPKKKAVGAKQKANNPAYKKENKKHR